MTTLTDAQIGRLAVTALDGNEQRAAVAVAICLAESGGRTDVVSHTGDYGLWQINRAAHPRYDYRRLLSDPAYNAQAMADISAGGTNWRPWVAYTNGSWEQFAERAAAAVPGGVVDVGPGDILGGIVSGPVDALAAVARFLASLVSWELWRRVLFVVGGLGLTVLGLRMLGLDLATSLPSATTT